MTISSRYVDGSLIIALAGELDHHTAAQTLRETRQILDRFLPKCCALDLSALSFMDSSGVAYILRLKKILLSYGADFVLLHPAEQPGRVIVASGLDRLVSVKTMKEESSV